MKKCRVAIIDHSAKEFMDSRSPLVDYITLAGLEVISIFPNENLNVEIPSTYTVHLYEKKKTLNIVSLFYSIYTLNRAIRLANADLIHSFKLIPNLIVTFKNLFNNKKVIIHVTGLGRYFIKSDSKKNLILRIILRLFHLIICLRANKVIFQNDNDAQDLWLQRLWNHKKTIIYGSGVDTEKFKPKANKRNEVNEVVNFIFASRLIKEKGIFLLLEAFKNISDKNTANLDNVHLTIIGGGRSRNIEILLKYQVKNKYIKFIGKVENLSLWLRKGSIFILPSYYREGIPRSLLEAAACGLPIITTNVPGCSLVVHDNGLLIEPKNVQAIEDAILHSLVNRDKWKTWGENSRSIALNKFSQKIIFTKILEIYNEFI